VQATASRPVSWDSAGSVPKAAVAAGTSVRRMRMRTTQERHTRAGGARRAASTKIRIVVWIVKVVREEPDRSGRSWDQLDLRRLRKPRIEGTQRDGAYRSPRLQNDVVGEVGESRGVAIEGCVEHVLALEGDAFR